MATISKDEQKWQAESDARTMASYQEILQDKQRLQRAIKAAEAQAKDLTKRANAMKSASQTKPASSRKK